MLGHIAKLVPVWVALIALVVAACSSPEPTATATLVPPTPTPTQDPATVPPGRIFVASSDLAMGPQRMVFAVLDSAGRPIAIPEMEVTYIAAALEEPVEHTGTALFRQWPVGGIGLYALAAEFDVPGQWTLQVTIPTAGGETRGIGTFFQVNPESASPGLGTRPPATENRTIDDVADLAEISTASPPDPDFYDMTIADALDSGKPSVVIFATPAYCQSQTCGPQLDVIEGIKDAVSDDVNFIHIEVVDNPAEIDGDFTRATFNPALAEWGLVTEPWTFVLDADGNVAAKYEGFVTRGEIEEDLLPLI